MLSGLLPGHLSLKGPVYGWSPQGPPLALAPPAFRTPASVVTARLRTGPKHTEGDARGGGSDLSRTAAGSARVTEPCGGWGGVPAHPAWTCQRDMCSRGWCSCSLSLGAKSGCQTLGLAQPIQAPGRQTWPDGFVLEPQGRRARVQGPWWVCPSASLFLAAQSSGAVEEMLDQENRRMADSLASKVTRLKSVSSGPLSLQLAPWSGGQRGLEVWKGFMGFRSV